MDINNELNEFFSYIKQAKQQKKEEIEAQEKEYRDLVGDLSLESVLADYSAHLRGEDPPKRKAKEVQEDKREKQIQEIDSWLTPQVESNDVKDIVNSIISSNKEPVVTENKTNDDVIDHALRILEKVTTKEEVQTNTTSPEISKIRRELENLKNIVAAQGGGGEVRLEFLDDVDRTSAKVDGKFLKYQSSTGKFIGADADATGLTGTPDIVVGIITADSLSVSGNISCAGTITYDDVTHVDSLGIGTFRSGVVVNTGTATTALVVNGDARITGILTIGTSSLTLNGADDSIQVGTGLTIRDSGDAVYSGVITATTFNGNLTGNVNSSGVSTFSSGLHVTGGNLGIGTTSPSSLLQVKVAANKNFLVQDGGTDTTELANYDPNDGYRDLRITGSPLRFHTGTAGGVSAPERVRIDSSGNVGIGTSAPNCQLTNTGTTSLGTNNWPTSSVGRSGGRALIGSGGVLLNWNETAGAGNAAEFYLGAATGAGANTMGYARLKGGTENGTNYASYFSIETSNTVGTPSTALHIDSSGRIGAGTASPSFASGGGLEVSQSSGRSNVYATSGSATLQLSHDGSIAQILNRHNSDLQFGTNNTERMRILSGGGLTFNGDTSTNNALDDYEIGTWTPTITRSTTAPSVTYSYREGRYVKVGDIVTAFFDVSTSAISGGSGNPRVSGLPFTMPSNHAGYSAIQWRSSDAFAAGAAQTILRGFVEKNSSYLTPQLDNIGTSGYGNYGYPSWASSGRITGYVTYQTAT